MRARTTEEVEPGALPLGTRSPRYRRALALRVWRRVVAASAADPSSAAGQRVSNARTMRKAWSRDPSRVGSAQ
eukprot:CAMPEP_0177429314 /NCGR_PEP_ID=MMETSP0368-20130122/75041_1 /TAXON_ID=447022 ORGANISM="Scrippsiella hangoei-like, Strain SHHI-4" /NCGR_SAMPLE_ID=MMETSP0368 /ASSEMBLY_ACC=CAM_ASM_000363 /LENGTH=72 /DNA_ID=CAMNT_0018899801 /DNA_START=69 /DNA_END=287 /DNA_ORIENTATION=-